MPRFVLLLLLLSLGVIVDLATTAGPISAETLSDSIDQEAKAIEARMLAWRRDIHQNPELGNREFRTSALLPSI